MNADQGFRRPPGNLLRVAAGAGAAVLIAAAASAARRARTATADRGSGSAHDRVSPSDVPVPEVPEAVKACDPAVGQVAISAALLLVSVTALSAVAGRRRGGGKRGAAHARTPGRQAENGDDVLAPEIPADSGDPWITGAPWSGRQEPAWHDADQSWYDGLRGQHTDDYPSWPGRPGPNALHPDHPSWGEGVPTRAGIARRRRCGRTATPAGRSPRPRRGPTPNRRRRTTVPDGAAEDPRDKNRRPGLTAARPAGQAPLLLRAMPPGQARLPIQDPVRGQATPRKASPRRASPRTASPLSRATRLAQVRLAQVRLAQVRLLRPTFPATDRRFSTGRPGSWNGSGLRPAGSARLAGASPPRGRSGTPPRSSSQPGSSPRPTSKPPRSGTRHAMTRPPHARMRNRRPPGSYSRLLIRPRRRSRRPNSRPPRYGPGS